MAGWWLTVAVGFASGLLSGMFGIGGGLVTTPAIRLLLDQPALVAVGTPLLAILPTTVVGASRYVRNELADLRGGLVIGACGIVGSILGAALTPVIGGEIILLATAALILYVGTDMVVHAVKERTAGARPRKTLADVAAHCEAPLPVGLGATVSEGPRPGDVPLAVEPASSFPVWGYPVMGAVAGLYSGLLGLGGGFVLVPLLVRWTGMPIKRAIGTSLVAISVLAVPGIATHWALGNIDPAIGLLLAVGSIPGAIVGARITKVSSESSVRFGFAALLLVVGVWLAASEAMRIAGLG